MPRGMAAEVLRRCHHDGGVVAGAEFEHFSAHVGRQQGGRKCVARPHGCGAAVLQRRQHDGACVNTGSGVSECGADGKVGAAHANGGYGGIEAEALAGGLAPRTGDGACSALVKLELDGSQLGLLGVVAVAFDEHAALRAHAEVGAVNKAQVNVAPGLGFNAVAYANGAAGVRARAGAVSRDDACLANDQRGFAHHRRNGCGLSKRMVCLQCGQASKGEVCKFHGGHSSWVG